MYRNMKAVPLEGAPSRSLVFMLLKFIMPRS